MDELNEDYAETASSVLYGNMAKQYRLFNKMLCLDILEYLVKRDEVVAGYEIRNAFVGQIVLSTWFNTFSRYVSRSVMDDALDGSDASFLFVSVDGKMLCFSPFMMDYNRACALGIDDAYPFVEGLRIFLHSRDIILVEGYSFESIRDKIEMTVSRTRAAEKWKDEHLAALKEAESL